jgi:hypothetical protein
MLGEATSFLAGKAGGTRHNENAATEPSRNCSAGGGPGGVRILIHLIALFWSASIAFAGTTYYVATNGTSGNDGLSTNTPWSLSHAITSAGASNTVIVMPGLYSGEADIGAAPYQTWKSQVKWGAQFFNSPGNGIGIYPESTAHHITIDGFSISNAAKTGIICYGSNATVRNCWVQKSGSGGMASTGSGFFANYNSSQSLFNLVVEQNLFENNGIVAQAGQEHGIYISGTNCVVRNNVCRNNFGYGIQVFALNPYRSSHIQVYNNLCYGNRGGFGGVNGSQMAIYSQVGLTNYAFGNTCVSTNSYCIEAAHGTVCLTNNIIISTGNGLDNPSGDATYLCDYNLSQSPLAVTGPHDVVSSAANFVKTNSGLYWLSGTSPARGMALSGVCGPVDFSGNAQSGVRDIGAFQYAAAYASDPRVLDPSGTYRDYWQIIKFLLPAQDLHVLRGP